MVPLFLIFKPALIEWWVVFLHYDACLHWEYEDKYASLTNTSNVFIQNTSYGIYIIAIYDWLYIPHFWSTSQVPNENAISVSQHREMWLCYWSTTQLTTLTRQSLEQDKIQTCFIDCLHHGNHIPLHCHLPKMQHFVCPHKYNRILLNITHIFYQWNYK